jgi:hypothetical protein
LLRFAVASVDRSDFEGGPRRRVLARDLDGGVCAVGWWSGREGWLEVPGAATFRFAPGDPDLSAIPDPEADQDAVMDAFLASAIPFALQASTDHEVVHGSALLTPRGVVACCGFSGSGKTTVAHALAARGRELWADDAVAIRIDSAGQALSTSLPFSSNLRPESRSYLGTGAIVATAEPWHSIPLAALVLLEVSDAQRKPTVRSEPSPARALHSLLPNAYRFVPRTPRDRRETVATYLEVAARVPVYRALYSRGFERLALLLDELERTVGV